MLRTVSTSASGASLRVASVQLSDPAKNEDEVESSKLLWGALDLCTAVGGAQTTPHTGLMPSGAVPWPALRSIAITFSINRDTDALIADIPILGPLTTRHAAASTTTLHNLQQLTIVNNANDESAALGAFAALATNLRELCLVRCGLTTLAGLSDRWEGLQRVDLWGCWRLSSTEGLEGHACLQEIDVSETPVASIEPLRTCPALTKVVVGACRQLQSLDGLEGHQWLEEVSARYTSITSLMPLQTCPALTRVDLYGCQRITSLTCLQGHPLLKELDASFTDITSVEPLQTCPALTRVSVSYCEKLTSLAGVEHLALLEELNASKTLINTVMPLLLCPALTTVDISGCMQVQTLDGLESHSQLLEVNAARTSITTLEPLRTCPALTKVVLHHCRLVKASTRDFPPTTTFMR